MQTKKTNKHITHGALTYFMRQHDVIEWDRFYSCLQKRLIDAKDIPTGGPISGARSRQLVSQHLMAMVHNVIQVFLSNVECRDATPVLGYTPDDMEVFRKMAYVARLKRIDYCPTPKQVEDWFSQNGEHLPVVLMPLEVALLQGRANLYYKKFYHMPRY